VRRALCVLTVALLLAACTDRQQVAGGPVPPEDLVDDLTAPLSGQPVDLEARNRVVAAVKIDNARAARPPTGLEAADVVIEELVEGGVTRFVALYHASDPGTVGPVRSGREVDADLLPSFDPVLGISVAAPAVSALFAQAGLLTLTEGQAGAFSRDATRRAPHNLYVSVPALWVAADGRRAPLPEPAWTFDDTPPDGGEPVASARLRFSPAAEAAWRWDGGHWLREQDGGAHALAGGEQVAADNVVVASVAVTPGTRRDASGNPTVHVDVLGEGGALLLRDGRAYRGSWRKRSAQAHFEWLGADGAPLALRPGRSWIELLPAAQDPVLEAP
jgi:hypothetical protein